MNAYSFQRQVAKVFFFASLRPCDFALMHKNVSYINN
jgi:hypothetical protein